MLSDKSKKFTLIEISDEDVFEAMRSIQGYIDITPADFREVYKAAYGLAKKRFMQTLTAADIMTEGVHVLGENTSLYEAALFLAEKGITGAPVTDAQGKLSGVISEKDFMSCMGAEKRDSFMLIVARQLRDGKNLAENLNGRTVGDIMTAPAITISADTPVSRISSIMGEKNINRLPVLDSSGSLAGIVTRSDLISSFNMLGDGDA
ncbi:CBS domain-containing protein [Seleniivibrio woodruffii]|uniref:CBS domain-containing protein n=1 Tax=Seleniivibrio woodruffii TaxID=1078050 RepID=UPI002409A910|nr:CBS domain-containing protein [Seleniivibrio woodruffii]